MPKLKAVTPDEIAAVINAAEIVSGDAHDLVRRLNSQTDLGENAEPISAASSVLASSRTLAELAGMLLLQAKLQEQKRTLEDTMRKRMKAGEKK